MEFVVLSVALALSASIKGDADGSVVVSSDEFLVESFRKRRLAVRRRRFRAFEEAMLLSTDKTDGGEFGSLTIWPGVRVVPLRRPGWVPGIRVASAGITKSTVAIQPSEGAIIFDIFLHDLDFDGLEATIVGVRVEGLWRCEILGALIDVEPE
jgi:hypothetical protein